MGSLINEVGNVHGRLKVLRRATKDELSRTQKRNSGAYWVCQCKCENLTVVSGGNLRARITKSCGCLAEEVKSQIRHTAKPEGVAAMNSLMRSYKQRAREHNWDWKITRDEFAKLTSCKCYYCGGEPSQTHHKPNANGSYIYNGIDRIDSDRGYVVDNVVACCKWCNYAKHDKTVEEFLHWAKLLAKHQGWMGN